MLIEIKGVQFVNKGAELMLYAILDKIDQYWPDAEICMEPNTNSPFVKRGKIGAYQKLRLVKNRFDFNGLSYYLPQSIRNSLKNNFGIVTEPDVDVILDASGFAYGDQWSYLPLKQISSIANRLRKKDKRYIVLPQALGPFTSLKLKTAATEFFEAASIVFARDTSSFKHVKNCSKLANVIQAPDFTNLLKPELPEAYNHLTGKVAIIPNSKILSQKNPDKYWRESYVMFLVMLVQKAQEKGEQVFLLNHEGASDQLICDEINNALINEVQIVTPENSLDVKAIIGHCRWVFSSRFHGCVSAFSQAVPCLATSWSHKYQELFADYQQEKWLVTQQYSSEKLTRFLSDFIDAYDQTKQTLAVQADVEQMKALTMWETVTQLV
ncbi:polysaccharide pyruvyl transferase family protein [Colwellia sp. MEBiC06753]